MPQVSWLLSKKMYLLLLKLGSVPHFPAGKLGYFMVLGLLFSVVTIYANIFMLWIGEGVFLNDCRKFSRNHTFL